MGVSNMQKSVDDKEDAWVIRDEHGKTVLQLRSSAPLILYETTLTLTSSCGE